MKHLSVIHIFLSLILMLVHQFAGAQDYVLTTKGDSLTGEVRPILYGPEKKVQLISADRKKTTLTLFQVRAFTSEGEIYHPVKGDNGYTFMKLLQPGYLSLYAYQLENQTRFDGLLLKKVDGQTLTVPNLGFRKYVSQFLEDCPGVVARIRSGELTKKNLSETVNSYNDCIKGRTIDHTRALAEQEQQHTKINAWDSLEEKIREKDFSDKNNALEMIAEIRKKIERQEAIPNFLVEGLRNSLRETGLGEELQTALDQVR